MVEERVWEPEEELDLLSGILECGFDNWTGIAKAVPPRTAGECEEYYLRRFIEEPGSGELAALSRGMAGARKRGALCSNNCALVSEESSLGSGLSVSGIVRSEALIRSADREESFPAQEAKSSAHPRKRSGRLYCQFTCPGYNPERSDFDTEYDDKAESLLSLLQSSSREEEPVFDSPEERDLLDSLRIALVRNYNFRLSERWRRKRIVRTHALLDRRKTYSMMQRYESVLRKQTVSVLLGFLQFFGCGPELDLLLERLQYQSELKLRINKMLNYRRHGLKFLSSVSTFDSLSAKRSKYKRELEAGMVPVYFDSCIRTPRRSAAPLTLHNLPGYNLLEDDEKDLCSVARIVPETYYSFKNQLIQECSRHNGLKLVQARSLIKIDVNKTRKIYDFLMARGFIWLPS